MGALRNSASKKVIDGDFLNLLKRGKLVLRIGTFPQNLKCKVDRDVFTAFDFNVVEASLHQLEVEPAS